MGSARRVGWLGSAESSRSPGTPEAFDAPPRHEPHPELRQLIRHGAQRVVRSRLAVYLSFGGSFGFTAVVALADALDAPSAATRSDDV